MAAASLARGCEIRSHFSDPGRRRTAKFLNLDKTFASFSIHRLRCLGVYRTGRGPRARRRAGL